MPRGVAVPLVVAASAGGMLKALPWPFGWARADAGQSLGLAHRTKPSPERAVARHGSVAAAEVGAGRRSAESRCLAAQCGERGRYGPAAAHAGRRSARRMASVAGS